MHVGGNAAPVSGGQMAPAEIIMMATLDSPTSSMMTSESGPPRSAKPCPLRLADHIADGPHFNARTKIGGEEPIELDEMGAGRRSVRRCGKCLGDIGAARRRGHDEEALQEVGSLQERAFLTFGQEIERESCRGKECENG